MNVDDIPTRIVVFSGKGGVGKTTVAVNLACAIALRTMRVGLLDADVTGPNVARMAGITEPAKAAGERLLPHERNGVQIVSLATLLPPDAPVIWRGPMRSKAIEQLLDDTEWGTLDALVVDLPPGTGDEVLTITQRVSPGLAIIVTTPQEVALSDARRAVNMAKKLEVPRIGLVENMSGLVCPHCGERLDLFGSGTGRDTAAELKIDFLGQIPLDSKVPISSDSGHPIVLDDPSSPVAVALEEITSRALLDTESVQ